MKAIFEWAGTLLYWGLIYYALVVEAVWASNIILFFVNFLAVFVFLGLFIPNTNKNRPSGFKLGLYGTINLAYVIIFASQGWFWSATIYMSALFMFLHRSKPIKTEVNEKIIDI